MDKEAASETSDSDFYCELAGEQKFSPTLSQTPADEIAIPDYLQNTYYWSYLNPKNINWLNQEWVVKLILWGQHNKLREAAFSEIKVGDSVLQTAAVYGEFSQSLSEHITAQGELKVIDVAGVQVDLTRQKLKTYPHAQVHLADASTFSDKSYDVVLCYFLLHEVPDKIKTLVLDNLLRHIKPNGKLVIVDYHKPHLLHPIRPITSLVFRFLEPFARTLWQQPLQALASDSDKYDWQQHNYFGDLFQKVVVTRKNKQKVVN